MNDEAKTASKIELTGIPDDAPGALRALADFLDEHPDVRIETIELINYKHGDFAAFRDSYAAEVEMGGSVTAWATLCPAETNEDRKISVEIVTFGDR